MRTANTSFNILSLLAMVVFVLSASASDAVEITQSLQPMSIEFESSAQFEIVISWQGPQSKYVFPRPLRPQFERLSAGELSSAISSVGSGTEEVTTKRYRYTLRPTLSGLGRIEPITIEYISWPDSVPGLLVTEPMTISIAKPKPAPPADSGRGTGFWLVLIGSILVVGGGGAYYLLVIKEKLATGDARSPEQDFLAALDALQKKSGDDLKQFQTGLYKLLVEYLARRYQIISLSGTASDLTEQMKSTTLPLEHREMISAWLLRAEKEKFSPAAVSPGATMRLSAEIKESFETKLIKH